MSMFPFNDPKTVAGKYGALFKVQKKRHCDVMPVIQLPPKTIGGLRDQMAKTKQCNCRRSYCLKLYCDCFQAGVFCQSYCNCLGCKNTEFGGVARTQAILVTLDRNPHAFRPRLLSLGVGDDGEDAAKRSGLNGCNCRKSFCLKKYCECFQAAVTCSSTLCRCVDCQNTEGNEKREALMKKRKKAEDSATAQAKAAQQHTRLALEGDETIAAIGVDAFLPPSTYTIPVKFPSGVPFAALAFGSCDNDQVTNPISAFLSKRPEMENAKNYGRATELETRWDEEAKEVGSLFSAAKKELKQRKGEPVKHNYLHDENLKKRASDLVNKADDELRRVRKAAENAEAAAIKRLDEMNGENMDDDLGTDESMEAGTETESLEANPLACAEALPAPKKPKLSKESVRELTILAYQDEAMLRELACMVREKTLKLSKIRKERNERVI